MDWLGREVRAWMYYILGIDHHIFRNLSIHYPMHKSDHYMVLGCLHSDTLREHTDYLGWCTELSLQLSNISTREDRIFAVLWRVIPKKIKGKRGKRTEY